MPTLILLHNAFKAAAGAKAGLSHLVRQAQVVNQKRLIHIILHKLLAILKLPLKLVLVIQQSGKAALGLGSLGTKQ